MKKVAWEFWLIASFALGCIVYFFYAIGLEISLYFIGGILVIVTIAKLAASGGKIGEVLNVILGWLGKAILILVLGAIALTIILAILGTVYFAIVGDKDMSIDLSILVLKSGFVRLCVIVIFCTLVYYGAKEIKRLLLERKKKRKN